MTNPAPSRRKSQRAIRRGVLLAVIAFAAGTILGITVGRNSDNGANSAGALTTDTTAVPTTVGASGGTSDSVLGQLSCQRNDTIAWDGTRWNCSPLPLSGLTCQQNDSIAWDGTRWICRPMPITATLSTTSYDRNAFGVSNVFPVRSANIDSTRLCDRLRCEFRLADVRDHTTCQFFASGQPAVTYIRTYYATSSVLALDFGGGLYIGQPLYITISCAR